MQSRAPAVTAQQCLANRAYNLHSQTEQPGEQLCPPGPIMTGNVAWCFSMEEHRKTMLIHKEGKQGFYIFFSRAIIRSTCTTNKP